MLNAELIISIVGIVGTGSVAMLLWRTHRALQATLSATLSNAESRIKAELTAVINEASVIKEHVSVEQAKAIVNLAVADFLHAANDVHAQVTKQLAEDHKVVVETKADLIAEFDKVHQKIADVQEAAVKGYDTAKEGLVAAARSVLVAERRTCSFCGRLVHKFETLEDGSAKCADCKAANR